MRSSWAIFGVIAVGAFCVAFLAVTNTAQSQPPAPKEPPDPAPPAGQTYTGVKACASCHFKQYMVWKKDKHSKEAWEKVPEKYRTDATCLPCHATGYGQETGFKDAASTPNLTGTTCEACHGPGSEHEKVAKKSKDKKKLDPDEEKEVRDSIYKFLPYNVCATCHLVKAHKEHPKYDKE
jgi:hypothetical protein